MGFDVIAVRGGHSLDVGGASSLVNEVKEDRKIYPYVIAGLKAGGANVVDVTPTKSGTSAVDLTTAMNKAKAAGADLFVSIHLNANDKKSHGVEAIYDNFTKEIADRIVANLKALGFYSRGTYADRRGLYEFNSTPNLANLIVECFFVDNAADVALYAKLGPAVIGHAIAEAILGKTIVSNVVAAAPVSAVEVEVSENVKALQTLCNVLGKTDENDRSLVVDGRDGTHTKAAVSKLPLCGLPYKNREATKYIQARLTAFGMYNGAIDGIFYTGTKNAVVLFQKKYNLTVDGLVGKNGWAAFLAY